MSLINYDKDSKNSFVIMHMNPRGYTSKLDSIAEAAAKLDASIVTLNETNISGNNKLSLPYNNILRNRKNGQKMGGISTSVREDWKKHTVLAMEGEDEDEFHVIQLDNFKPPLNIVNCYAETEGSLGKDETEARWARLVKEMEKIKERGEHCLLVSDANKHIGNDKFGVDGNHNTISRGGHLVRALLTSGDWFLINAMTEVVEGGPFTREDPATGHLSLLDIMIGSASLRPYVTSLYIDSSRQVAAKRPVYEQGQYRIRYGDHFTLVLRLTGLPMVSARDEVKVKRWNLRKEGGWDAFKEVMEEESRNIENVAKDESVDVEESHRKFEKITEKGKWKSFGKVTLGRHWCLGPLKGKRH